MFWLGDTIDFQWRRGLKKVAGAGSCNFSTNSCKFPTEEIIRVRNFNFAPKFSKNEFLSAKNFAFFDQNFQASRKISDNLLTAQNLGEGRLIPIITNYVNNEIALLGAKCCADLIDTSKVTSRKTKWWPHF